MNVNKADLRNPGPVFMTDEMINDMLATGWRYDRSGNLIYGPLADLTAEFLGKNLEKDGGKR